jgi:transcriptional regulator with XRE-family HTH domain
MASALTELHSMPSTREEFCSALKAARERRGLKLTDIAAATKVCPSYFSALERNDLRVWPKGLFRRSFFRGYASTIGLPVAETLEEFLRLFPEDERATAAAAAAATAANEVRLTLDESWRGPTDPIVTRLSAAGLDAAVVTLIALAMMWIVPLSFGQSLAAVAISYFSMATVLIGESPAAFGLRQREKLANLIAAAFVPSKTGTPPEPDMRDDQPWVTDARRVRPRGQAPGLRVRFKVSS